MRANHHRNGLRAARIVPGRLFIDESGQFRVPGEDGPPEVGLVAGFALPDTPSDNQRLAGLVSALRHRVFGSVDPAKTLKARMLDEDAYQLIGAEMRNGWVYGYRALSYKAADVDTQKETLANLARAVEMKRHDLGDHRALDLRLDFLKHQCDTAVKRHPVYLTLLLNLYLKTAGWFRAQCIVPRLRVWIDDRLDRRDHELLGFLGRFAFWTTFPEVYSNRLGALLGVDIDTDFSCTVSSDHEQDGLIIADAIAYVAGMVSRGQDQDGRHQRALDRMNTRSQRGPSI